MGAFSLFCVDRHRLAQGRFVRVNTQSCTLGEVQMAHNISRTTAIRDING
jgi:hypothetical protein